MRLGRRDLVRDLLLAVSQVEIDLALGATGRFSMTVVNAYDYKTQSFLTGTGQPVLDLLALGTEVGIVIGYGDARTMPVVGTGVVTEITTSFPETGMPEFVVSGGDHGFPLTLGKSSRTWAKARDSDAAQEIASFHNL